MAKAKICGLRTREAITAAVAGGAGWVGFVTFAKSPRHIAPEAAAALAPAARAAGVEVVSVLVDPDDALVEAVAQRLAPDWLQLHGSETPARAAWIKARSGARVIKALPVSTSDDLRAATAYTGAADAIMFDARPPPGADRPGGVGARFDWTILKGEPLARGAFLAGGLDPWNVGEALAASGVERVDVSSGVERGPGVKDPALITAFLQAVRRA